MKKNMMFIMIALVTLFLVGCGNKQKENDVNQTEKVDELKEDIKIERMGGLPDNLSYTAQTYMNKASIGSYKTFTLPVLKTLVIIKDNDVVEVVSEPGVYDIEKYSSSKYKNYIVDLRSIEGTIFESKIKLDKEYSYTGNMSLKIYDPAKFLKNIDYKEIAFDDYYNNYVKKDLENNLNRAISNIINEKNITIQEISSDVLSEELNKLMDNIESKGISITISINVK